MNNHAHIIRPKDEAHLLFSFYLLKGIPAKNIETGSIQKKISQENLLGYNVSIPRTVAIERCVSMAIFFIVTDLKAVSMMRFFRPEVLPSKLKTHQHCRCAGGSNRRIWHPIQA